MNAIQIADFTLVVALLLTMIHQHYYLRKKSRAIKALIASPDYTLTWQSVVIWPFVLMQWGVTLWAAYCVALLCADFGAFGVSSLLLLTVATVFSLVRAPIFWAFASMLKK